MLRHFSLALLALGFGIGPVAGAIHYVSPGGSVGFHDGAPVPVTTFRDALARSQPGDVIQLVPESPAADAAAEFRQRIVITGLEGAPNQPITVRGLGARTIIKGKSIDEIRGTPRIAGLGARLNPARPRDILADLAPPLHPTARANGMRLFSIGDQNEVKTCFVIENARWLVFEDLTFDDCWLPALHITDSQYIALRRSLLLGSSYAMVAFSTRPGRSHHFLVEDNLWIQDMSGYGSTALPECRTPSHEHDCPGAMWKSIPWGVSHHGSYEHFNGALFGAKDIAGDLVFRGNTIRNAYNGIRIVANGCKEGECSLNVEVYGNTFAYLRDNPIEMEHWAHNWWIHDNVFKNSHAWLSTDGMGGGPVLFFHNTGWFTDMPARECQDTWRNDQAFDYRSGRPSGQPTEEAECGRSRRGTVLKLGSREPGDTKPYRYPTAPLYLFNNSWFLRSPVAAGGDTRHLKHWNNAIEFCRPDSRADRQALCTPMPVETSPGRPFYEQRCAPQTFGFRSLWTPTGSLFADCFGWDAQGASYEFDFDISAAGFPPNLVDRARLAQEANGLVANPQFVDPERGDFRLQPGSPARDSGCTIRLRPNGTLACEADATTPRPNRGAIQQVPGARPAPYTHRFPVGATRGAYYEHPRVVKADWTGTGAETTLVLSFSIPVRLDSGDAQVLVRQRGQTIPGQGCILSTDKSALACRFPGDLSAVPPVELDLIIPRTISSAAPMAGSHRVITVWGSYPRTVSFKP